MSVRMSRQSANSSVWEIRRLADVCRVLMTAGKSFVKQPFTESEYPFGQAHITRKKQFLIIICRRVENVDTHKLKRRQPANAVRCV